jgi:sortase family protein
VGEPSEEENRRPGRATLGALALVVLLAIGGAVLVVSGLVSDDSGGAPVEAEAPGRGDETLTPRERRELRRWRRERRRAEQKADGRPLRAPKPTRLRIAALDVDAKLVDLGLDANGELEVPEDWNQPGWWKGGPRPGEPGAAVIVGHLDGPGGPAIFANLRSLERGQKVTVSGKHGYRVQFVVQHTEAVSQSNFPTKRVYKRGGPPTLRLITCFGSWDSSSQRYTENTVVFLREA